MPADMSKYPANWPEIRNRILRRAGGNEDDPRVGARCEKCNVLNYGVGHRDETGRFIYEGGNIWYDDFQYANSYTDAKQTADHCNEYEEEAGYRCVVIVLTIAHVYDPDPQNVDDDNLAAWCQRCHNRFDVEYRKRNRANTRRAQIVERGQGVLI